MADFLAILVLQLWKWSAVKSSTCRYSCRVIEWPNASRRPSVREEVPTAYFSQAIQHDEET